MNEFEGSWTKEQLVEALEEEQEEKEQLIEENQKLKDELSAERRLRSEDSSTISMLRKKVQEQSESIVKQNEVDKVYEENERLQNEAAEARRRAQEAEQREKDTIARCEEKCKRQKEELKVRETQVASDRAENEKRKKALDEEVRKDVDRRVRWKEQDLDREYSMKGRNLEIKFRIKLEALHSLFCLVIAYGLFTTLLTAMRIPRVVRDVSTVRNGIRTFYEGVYTAAVEVSTWSWALNKQIPYPVLKWIAPGALTALVWIIAVGVFIILIAGVIEEFIRRFFLPNFGDILTAYIALFTMAAVVWGADYIPEITWMNIILVWIYTQAAYIFIRMVLTRDGGPLSHMRLEKEKDW